MRQMDTICLAVIDSTGHLIGQLTVRDVRPLISEKATLDFNITLEEFWNLNDFSRKKSIASVLVKPEFLVHEVISKLNSNQSYKVYVVDEESRPIGSVSIREILGYIAKIDSAREIKLEAARRKVFF